MRNAQPEQWPEKRIRFLTRNGPANSRQLLTNLSQVTFVPMEAIGEHGELNLSIVRDIEEVRSGYTQFFDGDVLIAKITPCFENNKGALVRDTLNGVGFGTTELHVLTPSPEVDGLFLYYTTVSPSFRLQGEAHMTGAAGQKRVPEDFVRDFRIRVPPLSQQRAIANYLDDETSQLDALVKTKEQLLKLVSEKQVALATSAVTRGIRHDVRLSETGITWLGEIPAHWEVERARWLFRERDERSATGQEELLTVSHITGVTPRSEKDVTMFEAETTEGYKICNAGDLVINTLWAWMGAMGISPVNGIVSPAYNVYQPSESLDPCYIDALVRLPVFAQEVTRYSKGVWSSRLRLYPEGFFQVFLPVPPLEEQRAIITTLNAKTEKLAELKEVTKRSIALLKERRSELISAAVTGQINVEANYESTATYPHEPARG